MAIRFFDMFAGIGGFRSGLEAVGGFECVGHCEIDKYANQAYNAMYETKGEVFFADARTIDPEDLPDIDLICGGFPCQSLKMFPASYRTTAAGRLQPSSLRWMTWGTMSRGRSLTAKILESPNPARGCILSDILEENVPAKYFLSQAQMERLLSKSYQGRRDAGSTPPAESPSP